MTLDPLSHLNKLSSADAHKWFEQTCTSSTWCRDMVKSRPYFSVKHVHQAAKVHWNSRAPEDVLEALSGHPMIGEIDTLRAKYANTKALAKGEQSGMESASDGVLQSLKTLNHAYLDKHGFIFIICASGLSAKQMLTAIENRITRSTEDEFATATEEQLNITHLRIDKALNPEVSQ